MKFVLRHKTTGRYYMAPGRWVRRADNALAFDEVDAARQFAESNGLEETQTVVRLAPYLMPLLQVPQAKTWDASLHSSAGEWYTDRVNRFGRN